MCGLKKGQVRTWLRALSRSGTFWNMMGSGMVAASTVLLTMLVGHFFSLDEVGVFTLSLTTAQILYVFGLFGANDLQMTDYAHRFRFSRYFWLRAFSTAGALLAGIVIAMILWKDVKARTIAVLLILNMLLHAGAELYQSLYFQNRRLDLCGKALFYRYLISTAAFAAGLLAGSSLQTACMIMLVVNLVMTVMWVLPLAGKYRDSGYEPEGQAVIPLFLEAFPLCLSMVASLLAVNLPKYLINGYYPESVQGAYSILFMPVYAVNLLSQFVFKPYLPRYSQLLKEDRKGFVHLLKVHGAVIACAAAGCAAAMQIMGIWMLRVLFGQDLGEYRSYLVLFMLSGGLMAMNQLLYYMLVISGKQKTIFGLYCIAVATTFLTGFLAIPEYAVAGAWAAFTAGQACLMIGYLIALRRNTQSGGQL